MSGNATDAFLSPRVGCSVLSLANGVINALLFIIGAFDNAPIGLRAPVRPSLARRVERVEILELKCFLWLIFLQE